MQVSFPSPTHPPKIRFFGRPEHVQTYIQMLENNPWSHTSTFHQNLKNIFKNLTFPSPTKKDTLLHDSTSCKICFSFLDEASQIPSILCAKCDTRYHDVCLREWLDSLGSEMMMVFGIKRKRRCGRCLNCG